MGNQPSSGDGSSSGGGGGGGSRGGARFLRTTGLLGLSKAELDERCKPSGLYPSCNWEDKAIRKLVGDGKLAARLRGTENRTSPTDRECPICFLQYREVNTTKCCSAYICTECYLQVRPQKAKSSSCCPFCNHNKFSVTVAQAMNAEAMLAREETEQRFIEAKIRERAEAAAAAEQTTSANNPQSFGSSLQNDHRIATLRARSSSLSDHNNNNEGTNTTTTSSDGTIPEDVLRESFAMTPEERRMLEDEMRAQHSHPLSLRLEAEAQERRLRNEQEFLRQNPTHAASAAAFDHSRAARSRRGRTSERRNWNQIVEAFERGGHGEVNSLDDLVVLEAAMILSMEEESRRRGAGSGNNNTGSSSEGDATTPFDANRHANEGFPLVRSILSGGGGAGSSTAAGSAAEQSEQLQLLANSLNSRRRSRNSLMRAYGGAAAAAAADNTNTGSMETAMDTAGLLMRGISEDDQVAMAIAASLQDQQQQQQQSSEQQQQETSQQQPSEPQQQESQQQEEGEGNPDNTTTTTDTAADTGNDEQQQEGESSASVSNDSNEQGGEAVQSTTSEAAAETTEESISETPPAAAETESESVTATTEEEAAGAAPPPASATTTTTMTCGDGDALDVTNHGEE